MVPSSWGAGETGRGTAHRPRPFDGLAKILMALRAHDAAAVERLALPQSESRPAREPGDTVTRTSAAPPAPGCNCSSSHPA